METTSNELSNGDIATKIKNLELRISKLEEKIHGAVYTEEPAVADEGDLTEKISTGAILESKVGEIGLTWLGNIVLFFGIVFLVQYAQNEGYLLGASIFGYLLVGGAFFLAHFLKSTFPKKIYVFWLNAWLLLFYVTLKLHFFTAEPLIANKSVGILLLFIIPAVQLFIAVRKQSVLFATLSLVLFSIVAVVGDSTNFTLLLSVVISIIAVVLMLRYGWTQLVYTSLILVYLINLLWFLNNPLMGNQLQAITEHNYGFIYLFLVAAIYSSISLVGKSNYLSKADVVWSIVLNGIGFSILILFYTLSFLKTNYVPLMAGISAFCIAYAVILQLRSEWKITAALYALYGFVTFSIAVYGIYDFPRAYTLLAAQSLLVVSMAIWFRSKFIIVMNMLLFVGLLISYLGLSPGINEANVAFALVALATARLFNWKKDRLTIKTELMRNIYLLVGFTMVLISLYHLVPDRYITLSWTLSAVIYFGLSLVLKNVKYRYMALGSMIAAALYLFLIDLAKIELVFRILALMFLAIISIGLSVYYTRKSKKSSDG